MITENAKSKIISSLMILLIIGTVGALWLGSSWYINTYINVDYRGTFGDMFGAVNSLFSGLAFAGLIYTITVQRQELQEQRKSIQMQTDELTLQRQALEMQTKELKMQRKETERSADQLQMQQKLLDYQIILATVNDLIKLKNELIIKIMRVNDGYIVDFFKIWAKEVTQNPTVHFDIDHRKRVEQYQTTCFFLLQFVIDSKLSEKQTADLQEIVRINMSEEEAVVLGRIALEDGNQHRQALLKKFKLVFIW